MRDLLDTMISQAYNLQKQWQYLIEDMEELRAEMHNRPRKMQGRVTSTHLTKTIRRAIHHLHSIQPDLPQHEIARRFNIAPARISETIAGKRR